MKAAKPRILLFGAGAFGSRHLKTLLDLQAKKVLSVAGVVVRTPRSQVKVKNELKKLRGGSKVPVYRGFDRSWLDGVDAVDIVTPVETHLDLVRKCLPHVHVLVEKPIVASEAEAATMEKLSKDHKNIIMAGHIFRFNLVVRELKQIIQGADEKPHTVESTFFNPINTDNGRDPQMEMLHPFDIIDYIFGAPLIDKHVDDRGRFHIVSLRYKGGLHAVIKLGWIGAERGRTLRIRSKTKLVVADLDKNTIHIYQHGILLDKVDLSKDIPPLEAELRSFVKAINDPRKAVRQDGWPDPQTGNRIIKLANMGHSTVLKEKTSRKKVAIIGAGIFGTNCAIELSPDYDVTLFEKNDSILSEASRINQYRIHWGYHYPRSQETVDDIKRSLGDFESRYGDAIIREFPTYYSVAKEGSQVSAEEYIAFCERNKLPYTIENPHGDFLDREKISVCLKTYEPIYSYDKVKATTAALLKRHGVKVRLNSQVTDAEILSDGRKRLTIQGKSGDREDDFDYVINVTYARFNAFVKWLKFPPKPIRLDLVETLWIKLDIPKISLAVMDGKFTNVVPTGRDKIFTLVHIEESVHKRFVPKDGLVPKNIFDLSKKSRAAKIIARSSEWFPILKKAKIIKAHFVLRGVNASREHDDSRTSDISEHGFGCFSILGGKVDNSVSLAKKVVQLIAGSGLS